MSDTYISADTDPFFNLAVEKELLTSGGKESFFLFIYRNRASVIIGRNQNPWTEADLAECRRRHTEIARRISGGGTVYHDLGNSNFAFIVPRTYYEPRRFLSLVQEVLQKFGLRSSINARNDLEFRGAKISGTAYRLRSDRALLHGTLLMEADIERLTRILTPRADKIETKAIRSVASPVVNLRDFAKTLTHEAFSRELISAFQAEFPAQTNLATSITRKNHPFPDIEHTVSELADREWVFGHTPPFSQLLELPSPDGKHRIPVTVEVKKGIITRLTQEVDAAKKTPEIESEIRQLIGQPFSLSLFSADKKCGN